MRTLKMRALTKFTLALLPLVAAGCHTDMWRQPRHQAYDSSEFYPDGASTRPLLPGTIARGKLREDTAFFTGAENNRYVDVFPAGVKVDRALIDRGQERFDVYCSPCHGRLGNGQGMIAQRGFTLKRPVGNYHTDRLRKMPVGHFYDVITNGYGTMYSYASRVEPQDRWAIVAYIRVLQLSQDGREGDVAPDAVSELRQKGFASGGVAAYREIYGSSGPSAEKEANTTAEDSTKGTYENGEPKAEGSASGVIDPKAPRLGKSGGMVGGPR